MKSCNMAVNYNVCVNSPGHNFLDTFIDQISFKETRQGNKSVSFLP